MRFEIWNSERRYTLFVSMLLSAFGSSCSYEKPLHSSVQSGQVGSSQKVGTIGGGWNSETEEWKGNCLEGTLKYEGAQDASIQFDKAMSEKETASSLGFSLNARARYGVYEGDLAASFARDTASSSFSESATYSAVYRFKNAKLTGARLTPEGQKALDAGPDKFKLTCGHEYVDQLQLGARFFVNIKMEFSSSAEKQKFASDVGLKGPAFAVRAKLEKASTELSKSASVSVRVYQQGGNISRISSALNSKTTNSATGKDAASLVTCSMENMEACLDLIDRAINYATNTEDKAESFPNQINYESLDLSTPGGPAILGYVTTPWSDMAIYPPDPFTEAAVKDARTELLNEFENQLSFRTRVESVLAGPIRLSQEQSQAFQILQTQISKDLQMVVDAGIVCYTKFNDCSANRTKVLSSITRKYIQEEFDIEPVNFAQWCDISKLEIHRLSMKKTVDAMLQYAELDWNKLGQDPCGQANKTLSLIDKLDLSGKHIKNLEPISALKNLRFLNLLDNQIEDASILKKLQNLEILNLSRNRLSFVDFTKKLPKLTEFRAYNNPLKSMAAKSKLKALILTVDEACSYERQNALEIGLIDDTEFRLYEASNFGPYFTLPGDRLSGIKDWFLCSSVVDLIQ